jgi:glycosyltransferase involved in cell wall biosynthesis
MSKKVLIILPILGYGGTEKVIEKVTRICLKLNYRVTVYVLSPAGQNHSILPDNIELIVRPRLKSIAARIKNAKLLRALVKVHDIIIASAEKRPTYLVSAYSLFLNKTTLAFVHSTYPIRLMEQSKKHRFFMRLAYPTFTKVICVSDALAHLLKNAARIKPKHICTIYPGLEFSHIKKLSTVNLEENKPMPWVNQPYILNVSRIAKEKCLHDLIRAFKLISKKTNKNLVICGKITDHDYFNMLQTIIQDEGLTNRVFFPGFFSNPYPLIAHATLLVSTSSTEGFGLVLLEALILKCPLVSTNCPTGPNEITAGGQFGSLVPVGDVDAIANAMLQPPTTFDQSLQRHLEKFSHQTFEEKITQLLLSTTPLCRENR